MSAGISGTGFRKLDQLTRQMKAVQSKEFKTKVYKQLAIEGVNQVHESFLGERDPYGGKWVKSKLTGRRKGGKTLQDTRRLYNSFTYTSSSQTFRIGSRVAYAAIHNYGGKLKRVQARASRGNGGAFVSRRSAGLKKTASKRRQRLGVASTRISFLAAEIPKRQYLPDKSRGLGPIWTRAMEPIVTMLLKKQLGMGH